MRVLFLTDSLSDLDGIGRYTTRLVAALEDMRAGRPVANAVNVPYGCTIKYK